MPSQGGGVQSDPGGARSARCAVRPQGARSGAPYVTSRLEDFGVVNQVVFHERRNEVIPVVVTFMAPQL
jgi:hypothetical protein